MAAVVGVRAAGCNRRRRAQPIARGRLAKWTGVGWTRVGASASSASVRVSAFLAPDHATLTLVLLNLDATSNHTVAIASGSFSSRSSAVYRTSAQGEQTASLGALGAGNALTLPPRSVATVVLGP